MNVHPGVLAGQLIERARAERDPAKREALLVDAHIALTRARARFRSLLERLLKQRRELGTGWDDLFEPAALVLRGLDALEVAANETKLPGAGAS
jgi:hypothetical protein